MKDFARICNMYSAPVFGQVGQRERPAERGDWLDMLGDGKGVVAGDFTSYSRRWDSGPNVKGGGPATWTIGLIDEYGLRVCNSGEATYYKDNSTYSSAISLTLAGTGVQVSDWEVVKEEEAVTGSDHEVISWKVNVGPHGGPKEEDITHVGWKVDEFLKGGDRAEARKFWFSCLGEDSLLEPRAGRDQIEQVALRLQEATILTLDKYADKSQISPRSKRWWSSDISEQRKKVGRARKRWQKNRREDYEEYKRRKDFVDTIKKLEESVGAASFRRPLGMICGPSFVTPGLGEAATYQP